MSLFFGGGSKATPQFTGLATQTSSSAVPVTICWGQNRAAPNIIWQGDFQSHKQKQGKGGGKGGTTYTYSASFVLALCYGPSDDVVAVWKDQSKMSATETPKFFGEAKTGAVGGTGFSFLLGTLPQDPWGYLVSKHPDEALGYPGITLACASNYDLGQSNTLGQHSFEVQALRWNTAKGGAEGTLDADPALIVEDFLSDPKFGVGFDMSVLNNLFSTGDATTTGDGTFQTYCRAMGFGMSPILNKQQPSGEILERWAKLCNSTIVSSGYELRFVPYGPSVVEANGVKYVPGFEVRYVLTYDDFVKKSDDEDPIVANRSDPSDTMNSLSMIIANRANEYNELPVPWRDQGLVDEFGLRKADNLEAKEITELVMAQIVVALVGQREAYIRNSFQFTLPPKFCRLEAMDIVVGIDPGLGLMPMLITSVEENDDGDFEITADEYYESISIPTANTAGGVSNTPKNTLVEPGPSNPPIIMEPPASLVGGEAQIWIALSGGDGTAFDPNWGGAKVHLSTDDIQYVEVGDITSVARMGKTTATLATYAGVNPDTTNTLKVNVGMSGGEFTKEASAFDAETGANLCYVDGATKEYLSFEVPTLTGGYAYDLVNLWRGQYGSPIGSHASGSNFAFLDEAVFKYALPPEYIGKTLYIKFQSMNIFEASLEDISTIDPYVYTPSGAGYGTGTGGTPATPSGVSGSSGAGFNRVTWAPAGPNDGVTSYDIYRATGSGAAFGSATKIASAAAGTSSYSDNTATPGTAYTYFVVPVNTVGQGTNSGGQNLTALPAGGVSPWSVTATGTGASQGITLPYTGLDKKGVFVYINGLRFPTAEYAISGTTLTLTSNASGDSIEIIGVVQ